MKGFVDLGIGIKDLGFSDSALSVRAESRMWEGFYRNPDSYPELRRREVIAREFFTTKAISWGLLVLFLPQSAQSITQRNAKF